MVTDKGVMSGNNVSHAENRTRRRFLPAVKKQNIFSETLGRNVLIKVSNAGLRTLEHKGGLDAWLLDTAPSKLNPELRQVRKLIAEKAAASA
jgi:large subunit ribosomal protein L28